MNKASSVVVSALIAAGALVYGASPIDIIPEFLAGPLGFGDDAVVFVAAGVAIWRILRKRMRPTTELPPNSPAGGNSPDPA